MIFHSALESATDAMIIFKFYQKCKKKKPPLKITFTSTVIIHNILAIEYNFSSILKPTWK